MDYMIQNAIDRRAISLSIEIMTGVNASLGLSSPHGAHRTTGGFPEIKRHMSMHPCLAASVKVRNSRFHAMTSLFAGVCCTCRVPSTLNPIPS